jgi:hypothetical protein
MTVGRSALSGFVAMFHSDNHISLFVSLFNIAVRLGHMFQWITPIDDRFYLPCLNQLLRDVFPVLQFHSSGLTTFHTDLSTFLD